MIKENIGVWFLEQGGSLFKPTRIVRQIIAVASALSLLHVLSLRAQDLDFRRRHSPGTLFDAKIAAAHSVECEMKGPGGARREAARKKSFCFEGRIEILECDASGAPTALSFSNAKISGESDSPGQLFKKGYGNFILKWVDEKMLLQLEPPGSKPTPEEIELLAIAFRPPSSQGKLDDLLGEKREYKEGLQWIPPGAYLKKIFSSRGLSIEDKNIAGKARFGQVSTEAGRECANIEAEIEISGIDGFGFEYHAWITLPFDKSCPPVRTKSESVEKILKKSIQRKEANPLAEDFDEMHLTITHSLDASLIPLLPR